MGTSEKKLKYYDSLLKELNKCNPVDKSLILIIAEEQYKLLNSSNFIISDDEELIECKICDRGTVLIDGTYDSCQFCKGTGYVKKSTILEKLNV